MVKGDEVPEDSRRWADRAWDVGIRVIGVLLLCISSYFFVRLNDTEKKIQCLEVKQAVTDTEKAQILMTLGEIKSDVKAIKSKVGVP